MLVGTFLGIDSKRNNSSELLALKKTAGLPLVFPKMLHFLSKRLLRF